MKHYLIALAILSSLSYICVNEWKHDLSIRVLFKSLPSILCSLHLLTVGYYHNMKMLSLGCFLKTFGDISMELRELTLEFFYVAMLLFMLSNIADYCLHRNMRCNSLSKRLIIIYSTIGMIVYYFLYTLCINPRLQCLSYDPMIAFVVFIYAMLHIITISGIMTEEIRHPDVPIRHFLIVFGYHLFILSDTILAFDEFVMKISNVRDVLVMSTYFTGIGLIAFSFN